MICSEVSSPMDAVAVRLRRDGRLSLQLTLQALATDAVCPRAECLLSPGDHQWLMNALSQPITEGTEAALSALLAGLAEMLEDAPPSLVAKLDTLRLQSDFSSD
jgi:hypothetical protein